MRGDQLDERPRRRGPGAPTSERVPDVVCIAFALWTLCTHGVVALGGSLDQLIVVAGVAGVVAVFAFVQLRLRAARTQGPAADENGMGQVPAAVLGATEPWAPSQRARIVAAAAGVVALSVFAATRNVLLLWWCAVALLGGAAFAWLRRPAAPPLTGEHNRRAEFCLWTLALACAALTLVVHRFDIDDAFYVNVAVAAADHPSRALLVSDTLLGIPDLAIHNPAHRALTLELLNAAVSRLTGIPAIVCLHVLTAGLVALLIPLAHARLFRRLLPQSLAWTGAVLATTAVLWIAGDTHRSFGNYAFVRAWQGKAIFLAVVLPLIYAHAIRYAATGARRDWLRLAAAQVAAVGLTSTAIWAAPLAGGLALASQFRTGTRGLGVFARGLGACAYPLAVGLLLRGEIAKAIEVAAPSLDSATWLADSLSKILGSGPFEIAALGAMLLLATCARGDALRRFAIVVPLGALLSVLNPYLEESVRSFVTGPSHWRAIWAIPFPILLGLLVATPLAGARRGLAARSVFVAALLFVSLLPRATSLSAPGRNESFRSRPWSERGRFPHHLRFAGPGPKVDPVAYEQAARLVNAVPAGSRVVAPEAVGLWLGTFHDAPFPVSDRALYMTARKRLLGADEVKRRKQVSNFAADPLPSPRRLAAFRDGLRAYAVRAVLVRQVPENHPVRVLLRDEGFELAPKDGVLDLWVRGREASPPTNGKPTL
jgi:hypothetical protein